MSESEAFAWFEKRSGKSVKDFDALKSGVILCETINKLKPGTIKKVETYNAPFKHMGNIDNFIKVARALGIPEEDLFKAEDLYYGNNLPKVTLTLLLFANAAASKFGTDGVSAGDLESLRSAAAEEDAKGGKKTRQQSTGLGIFDSNASKHQALASGEALQKDRLVKKDMQAHAATAELSLLQADQKDKQKMITDAKRSGQDLIIRSKDEPSASVELGLFGNDQLSKQKMISEAKGIAQDKIVKLDNDDGDISFD